MDKLRMKIGGLRAPLMIIGGLLAAMPCVRADSLTCSNSTLSGDYGFVAQGVLIPDPSKPAGPQFRSSGVARFDGKGHLTWLEHTVVNGSPLQAGWVSASGTYTVNSDCTGKAVATTPNSPGPLSFYLVVDRQGKEVRMVLDFHAIAVVFTKVD
jgi:hypothetical protein